MESTWSIPLQNNDWNQRLIVNSRRILGAYWAARKESMVECEARFYHLLSELSKRSSFFEQWFKIPKSLKSAPGVPFNFEDKDSWKLIFEEGRNRENVSGEADDELGYQIELWNGQKGRKQTKLSVRCGLSWQSSSPSAFVGNCTVLDLPRDLDELGSDEVMTSILEVFAIAWNPDWAGIFTESAMIKREFDPRTPFVDWIIYVPRNVHNVPAPSTLKTVPNGGSIIVVQSTPPSETNSDELRRIQRIQQVLSH